MDLLLMLAVGCRQCSSIRRRWGTTCQAGHKYVEKTRLSLASLHMGPYMGKLIGSCEGAQARAVAQATQSHQHPERGTASLPPRVCPAQ